MGKRTNFLVILCFYSFLSYSQISTNKYLIIFDEIAKGDTSYFRKIPPAKDTSNNFAYYLCKALLCEKKEQQSTAFNLYMKAIELALSNKDKSISHIKVGIYLHDRALLIPSLQHFNKAELLYSYSKKDSEYIVLNKYIGLIHSYLGNSQKSNERFLKIYECARANRNLKLMASSANNIAINYTDMRNYEKAEQFLNISLNLRMEMKDKFMMGQSYNNFGSLYFEKGEYEKAIQYYNKGYLLRKNFSTNFNSITESEINLGKTYLKLAKSNEAERILKRAYDKVKYSGHVKFISLTSFYLKDIYKEKNDYKNAYAMLEEYQNAKDSLYGLEKKEEVNRLTMQSEFKGKILSDSVALVKKDGELNVKEAKNEQNKNILILLGVLLMLVLFIVYNLFRQNKIEQAKNHLISQQSNELKEQNKEIKDSINYAQTLQASLLPSNQLLENCLKNYFIFYLPKDVVSGDFYWSTVVQDKETLKNDFRGFHFALADCTGHGVPGAMVSIVGITALTRCVKEFGLTEPAQILDKLSDLVSEAFSNNNKQLNDGMDISFCTISGNILKWAGANNPLWIMRNNKLMEFKGTRRPVGAFVNQIPFKEESVNLQKGDVLYLVTDGFSDQFGGIKGKKFKQNKLKELIMSIHEFPLAVQKEKLQATFEDWKNQHEQIDDVSVIGFKI